MFTPPEWLADVITDKGAVTTDRLAEVLRVTKTELAEATGLSRDAVSKRDRSTARTTQTRLRDIVEIINRVIPWAGSVGRLRGRGFRLVPIPAPPFLW